MGTISFQETIKLMVGDNIISTLPYTMAQRNCLRVLIVCDEPAYRLGYVDMVKNVFINTAIEVVEVYKGVGDVATDKNAEEIARKYTYLKCDAIIAVGKKATVEAAKGAKILLIEGVRYVSHYIDNSISEYATQDVQLFVIPTNFGSGFEALQSTRLYDNVQNNIYEFKTEYAATNVLVMDTQMTDIIPPKAIATYGLFALSLALECYVEDDSSMIAKAYADVAISTVYKYLTKCIFKNANKEYRQKIMEAVGYASCAYASVKKNTLLEPLTDIISDKYLANFANIYTILFRHHIQEVEIGRAFGYILNAMVEPNDFALYAREARGQKALAQVEALYAKIEEYVDFNAKLRDFGVKEEDLEGIADAFMKYNEDETITKDKVMQLLRATL